MKNLLDEWDEFKKLVKPSIFLGLDYDGTLRSIDNNSSRYGLGNDIEEILSQLSEFCTVVIISGRTLEDLISRISIENVYLSGNHGIEISGPGIDFISKTSLKSQNILKNVFDEIRNETQEFDSVDVIDKNYSISVDYRGESKKNASKVIGIVEDIVKPYEKEEVLQKIQSKKSIEIRPKAWNKGKAVSLLQKVIGFEEDVMTIYIGDDISDEDVFSTLQEDEVGILVSSDERETAADFQLNNVQEVEEFLKRLLNLFESS